MAGINGLYFIVSDSSSGLDSGGHALWRGLVRVAPEKSGGAASRQGEAAKEFGREFREFARMGKCGAGD